MLTNGEGKFKVQEELECAALSTDVSRDSLFVLYMQTQAVIILCRMRFTYHSTTEVRSFSPQINVLLILNTATKIYINGKICLT